jgi:hypothetical protein
VTGAVVLEVLVGGRWRRVGGIGPAQHPGSVSSDDPGDRQVFVFGYVFGSPGLWRSVAGWDAADPATRVVVTSGLTRLSDLAVPYEWSTPGREGCPLPCPHRLKTRNEGISCN